MRAARTTPPGRDRTSRMIRFGRRAELRRKRLPARYTRALAVHPIRAEFQEHVARPPAIGFNLGERPLSHADLVLVDSGAGRSGTHQLSVTVAR